MEAAGRVAVDYNSLLNQELDSFIFAEEEFVKSKNRNAEQAAQCEKLDEKLMKEAMGVAKKIKDVRAMPSHFLLLGSSMFLDAKMCPMHALSRSTTWPSSRCLVGMGRSAAQSSRSQARAMEDTFMGVGKTFIPLFFGHNFDA